MYKMEVCFSDNRSLRLPARPCATGLPGGKTLHSGLYRLESALKSWLLNSSCHWIEASRIVSTVPEHHNNKSSETARHTVIIKILKQRLHDTQ